MGFLYNPIKFHQSGHFVTLFFVALCGFSLVMVVFLNTKKEHLKQVQPQDITRFEMFDFQYFKITPEGVSTIASGKKAKENSNKESALESLSVKNRNEKTHEHLQADFAIYNDHNIFFPQGVTYLRDSTRFWSQEAHYFPTSKELEGKGEFIILDKNTTIRGRDILYKDGKFHAVSIYGILKE